MADEESLLELGELEAKFIANGKSYGYSKDALRSYVELRLADVEARRTRKEEQVKIKQELDDDTRRRERARTNMTLVMSGLGVAGGDLD